MFGGASLTIRVLGRYFSHSIRATIEEFQNKTPLFLPCFHEPKSSPVEIHSPRFLISQTIYKIFPLSPSVGSYRCFMSRTATSDTASPTFSTFWAATSKFDMENRVSVGQRVQETLLRTTYRGFNGISSKCIGEWHTCGVTLNCLILYHDGITLYLLHACSP